ncbi:DUF1223 domain-containing protein [Rhodobacteraceae bacterium]|nr:DUF1223 domain-containing protein [Paracoccaceae bacterium]
MRRFLSLCTAFWMTSVGAVAAEQAVVVELFTSQGCSSCPPADKILGELAKRDYVIALSLHVDYWDYLGWKDQFAQEKFTGRQRAYAHAAGERTIYTPQMIIGGIDHVIGSRPMQIADFVQKHRAKTPAVNVDLSRNGDQVVIEATRSSQPAAPATVYLVTYVAHATADIRRGENAGRKITYHHVVQEWVELGRWTGSDAFTADAKVAADVPFAVLVQSGTNGPMLGAAQLR